MGEIIRPTFLASDFDLTEMVPNHSDLLPAEPHPQNAYWIAIDPVDAPFERPLDVLAIVPDRELAERLIAMRIAKLELGVRMSGRVEDVYLIHGSQGSRTRVYEGWWPDNTAGVHSMNARMPD